MRYSIIVPCYNCDSTIKRLLDSILIQNTTDFEVILVDDTEDHSFLTKVKPYYRRMDLKVVNTDLKLHNPGNSRNYGLDVATGDWVIFIDCDDTLRDRALQSYSEVIDSGEPCLAIWSKIKQFTPDDKELVDEYQAKHMVWVHGKCYNRNFLNNCGIRFIPDMKACEDYFFNYLVYAYLLSFGTSFKEINTYTYNWKWNNSSLSRSNSYIMNLKEHFYDHIYASLIPWTLPTNSDFSVNVYKYFEMFLVISYFLYQYYLSKNITFKKGIVEKALNRTWEVFGITILDIINNVETHYDDYIDCYNKTVGIVNENFVCQQSFRDWLLNICK